MAICKACGKEYTKKHNRQMYCCDDCRKESRKKQNRDYFFRWYHKNKYNLGQVRRYGMGTGSLGPHAYTEDWKKESSTIKREKARRGIA